MVSFPKVIELRYFPILGRVQPLRDALADAQITFADIRLSEQEWTSSRDEAAVGGPYRGLPTLQWGAATLAETLPIASFLARALGNYEGLDDVAVARLEAVVSNVYLEQIVRLGEFMWSDIMFPGADALRAAPMILGRALGKLDGIERQLSAGSWFGNTRPAVADFFAAEGLRTIRFALGAARDEQVGKRFGALSDLCRRLDARLAARSGSTGRPERLTARPDEADVVRRLHVADLSALGM